LPSAGGKPQHFLSQSQTWVPHPRQALVFVARVGNHKSQLYPVFLTSLPQEIRSSLAFFVCHSRRESACFVPDKRCPINHLTNKIPPKAYPSPPGGPIRPLFAYCGAPHTKFCIHAWNPVYCFNGTSTALMDRERIPNWDCEKRKTQNWFPARIRAMKRFDRAMYAIFLLVLLADVARAHASVPAGGDAGLILSAAGQLHAGSADGAILVLRRSDCSSSQIATLGRFALKFSAWSRNLSDLSNPGIRSEAASSIDVSPGLPFFPPFKPACPSQATFEHTGSPAP